MTLKRIALVAAALLTAALPMRAQSARKLDISFSEGKVSIVADNVTLAEVLAEWSRKGGSTFVNAERLPATRIQWTEFKDQPEAVVLASLLREAPGYGAAMRPLGTGGASTVQTVFILAVRTQIATANTSQTIVNQPQQQSSPVAAPRLIQGSPDDEIPPVRPLTPDMNPGAPSTPANNPGAPNSPASNPNLITGKDGSVTSRVPGVTIPGPTPTPKPGTGRGGGGGSR